MLENKTGKNNMGHSAANIKLETLRMFSDATLCTLGKTFFEEV